MPNLPGAGELIVIRRLLNDVLLAIANIMMRYVVGIVSSLLVKDRGHLLHLPMVMWVLHLLRLRLRMRLYRVFARDHGRIFAHHLAVVCPKGVLERLLVMLVQLDHGKLLLELARALESSVSAAYLTR